MSLSPSPLAKDLFPTGTVKYEHGDFFEVNGLCKNSMPQNCTVLSRQQEFIRNGDRREYFLVEMRHAYAYFRICTAMENSGYDEYVAGFGVCSKHDTPDVIKKFLDYKMNHQNYCHRSMIVNKT
jgi:hypothetical protein